MYRLQNIQEPLKLYAESCIYVHFPRKRIHSFYYVPTQSYYFLNGSEYLLLHWHVASDLRIFLYLHTQSPLMKFLYYDLKLLINRLFLCWDTCEIYISKLIQAKYYRKHKEDKMSGMGHWIDRVLRCWRDSILLF